MTKHFLRIFGIFTTVMFCPVHIAVAGIFDEFDVGYRFGLPLERNEGDFRQYELYAGLPLPWQKQFRCGWNMESLLDVTLAFQEGEDDRGAKISTAGELFLYSPGRTWSLAASLGVGVMSEEEVGEVDYSGPVFFFSNIGLRYWLTPGVGVGYMYHHESNCGIYDKNPSVNMHMLEVRLSF